jgi:cytochrome c5
MSARRLAGLLVTSAALAFAVAGFAARAAAPRGGTAVVDGAPGASLLAAAAQATEPQASGTGEATVVPKKLAYAATLPDSAGRSVAERWCLMCHSAMLITQQAKDSTGWEKTLTQMETWGVATTPEERDSLRTYLLKSFGPRAAAPR